MPDATGRHAADALLRSQGFRIHSRPRSGEPLWERHGAVYPQPEALGLCPAEAVRDARAAEELYWESSCR